MHYSILYRGPLSSCNYGCDYCPFAKQSETHEQLEGDRVALGRFLDWCQGQSASGHQLSVLFTPWGEALIRSWYQEALARLTHMPHVRRAAIQTNISCHLKWLDRCNRDRLALWCTYHPTETSRERFLDLCHKLDERGVRYSVGIVGLNEHMDDAKWLREQLAEHVYLWVNAYKRIENYYDASTIDALTQIDPLFPINNVRHPSRGNACRAGEEVFSVDGNGTMRRCHFIKDGIGNIYDDNWASTLAPRLCSAESCGCHIGYVHMDKLELYDIFGNGVLERIPKNRIWSLPQVSARG
jgi:sulfatase maturation enzyme AslB (radical SAM superfamily)